MVAAVCRHCLKIGSVPPLFEDDVMIVFPPFYTCSSLVILHCWASPLDTTTMSRTFFIAGITGNVGGAAARHLLAHHPDVHIRALVRDLAKAQSFVEAAPSRVH